MSNGVKYILDSNEIKENLVSVSKSTKVVSQEFISATRLLGSSFNSKVESSDNLKVAVNEVLDGFKVIFAILAVVSGKLFQDMMKQNRMLPPGK
jgi:hypothetical protein